MDVYWSVFSATSLFINTVKSLDFYIEEVGSCFVQELSSGCNRRKTSVILYSLFLSLPSWYAVAVLSNSIKYSRFYFIFYTSIHVWRVKFGLSTERYEMATVSLGLLIEYTKINKHIWIKKCTEIIKKSIYMWQLPWGIINKILNKKNGSTEMFRCRKSFNGRKYKNGRQRFAPTSTRTLIQKLFTTHRQSGECYLLPGGLSGKEKKKKLSRNQKQLWWHGADMDTTRSADLQQPVITRVWSRHRCPTVIIKKKQIEIRTEVNKHLFIWSVFLFFRVM